MDLEADISWSGGVMVPVRGCWPLVFGCLLVPQTVDLSSMVMVWWTLLAGVIVLTWHLKFEISFLLFRVNS